MMNQKEATYKAVCSVTGHETGVCQPTQEQRAQIIAILVEGFKNKQISLDREYTEVGLKNYVGGLVSNWLRKDKRLNGGTAYVAKNPGSRAGSGDAQLIALRKLLKTELSAADRAEVEGYIAARMAELSVGKQVVINYNDLPAELAAKFKK
jgi:hypothetical protein